MAAVHNKNADDNKKSKKKFEGTYDSPFTLNIEFTTKVGVFFGAELDCLSGDKDPDDSMCTLILDLEFVFYADISLDVELFKICIFGACWTPKITVSLLIIYDKVIYANMIGFEEDKDGPSGWTMACDRQSDYSKYGIYKFAVHSAINKFQFGGLDGFSKPGDALTAGQQIDKAANKGESSQISEEITEKRELDKGGNSLPAPVATYDKSEISLKITFFKINIHIPDSGCV